MTRRSVAAKTTQSADALMAWLRTAPGVAPAAGIPAADANVDTARVDPAPIAAAAPPPVPIEPSRAAPPAADPGREARPAPLRLAHTDWLHHRLRITGRAADLAAFRAAAAGSGTVPWQLDLDRMAEDFFHLLAAPPARAGSLVPPPRSLSLAGARIVADQLCAAVARRHTLAVARVGRNCACPFDLHALVPVPDAILRRGPDDPDSLDWLWAHWGTTQTLRHVAEDEAAGAAMQGRAAPDEVVWAITFWSADWTPWRALAGIAAGWPTLRFDTRPTYAPL